ncbi:MAG TPA: cyclic nucleotide-binding domain-containing protein, partial [Candidatus Limnocylindria bacterium]|nr:cyclic nucleotide-binding domain-containing protein [Candidatus Limnocylindria bacterium]
MSSVDEERGERLRSVDLTSGLDRVALARLAAYMDPISVRAGDTIITEGETGDALYIVVRGTFAVLAGPDAERLNTIGPGHYMGELALLVDEPRSATIRADTDGEVLRLDR